MYIAIIRLLRIILQRNAFQIYIQAIVVITSRRLKYCVNDYGKFYFLSGQQDPKRIMVAGRVRSGAQFFFFFSFLTEIVAGDGAGTSEVRVPRQTNHETRPVSCPLLPLPRKHA